MPTHDVGLGVDSVISMLSGRPVPHKNVPHRPRLRVHGDARLRAQLPDAGADPARRHPVAPLRGRHGGRDAGAEGRGEHLSVEGAEGAHPAGSEAGAQLHAGASAGGGVRISTVSTTLSKSVGSPPSCERTILAGVLKTK